MHKIRPYYFVDPSNWRFGYNNVSNRLNESEEDVRQWVIQELLETYGYDIEQLETEVKVKMGSENRRSDIAVFDKPKKYESSEIEVLIEVKRNGITDRVFEEACEQLQSYMSVTFSAKYGLVTDGTRFICFHKNNQINRFDNIEDIPTKTELENGFIPVIVIEKFFQLPPKQYLPYNPSLGRPTYLQTHRNSFLKPQNQINTFQTSINNQNKPILRKLVLLALSLLVIPSLIIIPFIFINTFLKSNNIKSKIPVNNKQINTNSEQNNLILKQSKSDGKTQVKNKSNSNKISSTELGQKPPELDLNETRSNVSELRIMKKEEQNQNNPSVTVYESDNWKEIQIPASNTDFQQTQKKSNTKEIVPPKLTRKRISNSNTNQ